MLSRRDFLRRSSLIALAPSVPVFLSRMAYALDAEQDQRILVIVQMDGGNDGINTVIPIQQDEGYRRLRSSLYLDPTTLVSVNAEVGLHPSLASFGTLLEKQQFATVQAVGYPNPDRSHDISMSIWHAGHTDAGMRIGSGWLGRALDQYEDPQTGPNAMLVGDNIMPMALMGRRTIATAIQDYDELLLSDESLRSAVDAGGASTEGSTQEELLQYIRRTTTQAYATSDVLRDLARSADAAAYPGYALAQKLQMISQLIKGNMGSRIFYTVQPGYDTHSAQLFQHQNLMAELSESILAFINDLEAAGLSERVLVMCFSEFGRTAAENGSQGTDHGTAGPVFLAGPSVIPGAHAATPNLSDLVDGDIKMSVDFRQVYASILKDWMQVDAAQVIGAEYEPLQLFA